MEKCIKAEDIPVKPAKLGTAPDNLEQALSLALAKISEWTRFGNKTDEIFTNCT